jgi:predicted site-specific integrase-resolvase
VKRTYSTQQVAAMTGIHWMTLHRWLAAGMVRASIGTPMNGRTLWRWTDADVKKVRKHKESNYRKGRGRKPKPKR